MFSHLESGDIEVCDIDKPQLLIELFNNAKKSKWTEATIGNEMCPDEFVRDIERDIYQPLIQKKLAQLSLSEEKAKSILAYNQYVDYIGPVAIKINFSKNMINVTAYNETHAKGNNIKRAEELVRSLKEKLHRLLKSEELISLLKTKSKTEGPIKKNATWYEFFKNRVAPVAIAVTTTAAAYYLTNTRK
jgi:hypothetical protein